MLPSIRSECLTRSTIRHEALKSIYSALRGGRQTAKSCRPAFCRYASDWNANQYLKFGDQRTMPVRDLLAKVPLTKPKRIIDLGCGPGNSTVVLAERFPEAKIMGIDSSTDMLEKARQALPNVEFKEGDLKAYEPDHSADLFFSNAVFHWLPRRQRLAIMKNILSSSSSGTVLAIQVPNNDREPSHAKMRQVARELKTEAGMGNNNPLNTPFPTPGELYNSLKPLCSHIEVWRTIYNHVLEDHQGIIEWVKGTGLRPFIDPLPKEQRKAYLQRYLEEMKKAYEPLSDGRVMLRYPRLFLVAVRK